MANKAKNRLSKIGLDEVSLVTAPANPGASVLLLKSKTTGTPSTDDSAGSAGTPGNIGDKETQMTDQEKAALAKALFLASLNDAEKNYLKSLSVSKQAEFQAVTEDKRADFVKANPIVVDDGETLVVAGETIKKSEVGIAVFNVLKAQNSQIGTMSALLTSTTTQLELETFAKRAETEYPYLPGTREEKGAMLKHIETLPAVVKATTLASLKAASEAIKYQSTEVGATGLGVGDAAAGTAAAEMESLVKTHLAANPATGYDAAYTAVLKANPQLYDRMEAEKPATSKAA